MKFVLVLSILLLSTTSFSSSLYQDLNIDDIRNYDCSQALNDGFQEIDSSEPDLIRYSKTYHSREQSIEIKIKCDIFDDSLKYLLFNPELGDYKISSNFYYDVARDMKTVFGLSSYPSDFSNVLSQLGDRKKTSRKYGRPTRIVRDVDYDFLTYIYLNGYVRIEVSFDELDYEINDYYLEIHL